MSEDKYSSASNSATVTAPVLVSTMSTLLSFVPGSLPAPKGARRSPPEEEKLSSPVPTDVFNIPPRCIVTHPSDIRAHYKKNNLERIYTYDMQPASHSDPFILVSGLNINYWNSCEQATQTPPHSGSAYGIGVAKTPHELLQTPFPPIAEQNPRPSPPFRCRSCGAWPRSRTPRIPSGMLRSH